MSDERSVLPAVPAESTGLPAHTSSAASVTVVADPEAAPLHRPAHRRTFPVDVLMVRASVLLAVLCLPLAVVIALRGLPDSGVTGAGLLVFGAVLMLVAFVAVEVFPFRIEVRRETLILNLAEFPLVLSYLLMPSWLVLACHFAAAITVYLVRRDAWRKIATNTMMTLLESVVAIGAMLLIGAALHQPATGLIPVGVGVLLGALSSSLAIGIILHLAGPAEPLPVMLTRTLVAATTLITFGLVFHTVWVAGSLGPFLALFLGLFLVVLFVVFRDLMGNKDDMAAMYAFVQSVATMQAKAASWPEMLELIRENQNASLAIIHLEDPADPARLRVQAVDPDGLVRLEPMAADDPILIQAAELGVARVSVHRRLRPALQDSLDARGSRDLMVVALRADHRIRGYLEVRDRRSRWGRFGERDLRSLQTLSGHVATALDNVRLVERLKDEAQNDSVTGLRNQTGLGVDLQAAWEAGELGALVLLRLGMLSTVNGAIGYDRGNDLLRMAADRLRAAGGRSVARLEGDLFAVVLESTTEAEIVRRVANLIDALGEQFNLDGVVVEPDPYAGVALNAQLEKLQPMDPAGFEQRAEMALNAAEDRGEPYAIYRSTMGEVFRRRFQLVTQFRGAVETGQITLYYQPKVSLKTNQLVGAEALMRWEHPEFGMVSPGEFVPAIEATAFVQLMFRHALDTVLVQIRRWATVGLTIPVAVNVSVRNLTQDFPALVAELLATHQVSPTMLAFEVTESSVMDDPEEALPILHALHDLGIKLSIDDFGTGYSSLAYLRKLPIDEIKIDRSFVWGMSTGISDLAIVQSIIDLGHSLGKQVVAEGVEEETSREALKSMNCDVMQGFLLSRPLPAARFEEWISARMVRTMVAGSEIPTLRLA